MLSWKQTVLHWHNVLTASVIPLAELANAVASVKERVFN